MGLRRMERELDIVYFMRKQFVLNSIIRALTTKVQRGLARRQYSLIVGDRKDQYTTESSDSGFEMPEQVEDTPLN